MILSDCNESIKNASDNELLRVLAIESDQYSSEYLQSIRIELRERRLTELSLSQYFKFLTIHPDICAPFCPQCYINTTNDTPGNIKMFNFIGTQFLGKSGNCDKCGSIKQRLWFRLIIPIIPISQYRVIYKDNAHSNYVVYQNDKGHFFARRVRN